MGMYTELAIGIAFKEGTPSDVVDAMKVMAIPTDLSEEAALEMIPKSIRGHALFGTQRWFWMLRSGGSYYFDAKPVLHFEQDEIDHQWRLTVWTNIKNYSSEWQEFLRFIAPWIDGGEFEPKYIGHYRYEESVLPSLLYAFKGEVVWVAASGPPGYIEN